MGKPQIEKSNLWGMSTSSLGKLVNSSDTQILKFHMNAIICQKMILFNV